MQIVSYEFHASFAGRDAFGQLIETQESIVVGDDVERLLVGRNGDAVGFVGVSDNARDLAVGIDAVDRHDGLLDWLVAEIAGVAKVNAPL